ncbi:ubiquitin-conjugating enzyme E2 R2 [Vespula maculifrons]|uniref:Ubiquitin-conjugating enzyme E2 R2 n=1 Tax=Vespula maculifrons TaxID=7453 RepID=A0ABD2CSA1_VESMC
MAQPTSSALRALALEYKSLQEEPVEGFRVKLVNEDNMFEWEVAIFGPPDTLYQGGYFKSLAPFISLAVLLQCSLLLNLHLNIYSRKLYH